MHLISILYFNYFFIFFIASIQMTFVCVVYLHLHLYNDDRRFKAPPQQRSMLCNFVQSLFLMVYFLIIYFFLIKKSYRTMSRHWADIIIDHHLIVVIHNNALSHCCCCCCGCLCWCCCHTNCIVVVHKWIVENVVNFYLRILFYLIIKNDFFFNFTHYPLKCCTRFVSFFFFNFLLLTRDAMRCAHRATT